MISKKKALRLRKEKQQRQLAARKEYEQLLSSRLPGCSRISHSSDKFQKNYSPRPVYRRGYEESLAIPSRVTATPISGTSKDSMKYSGEVVIGIATMHKSNAVPIISKEQAIESAKMRR